MTRESIAAAGAPAPGGPYSHAVRSGGLLFLSGQTPLDPDTGLLVGGGIEAQTRQAFANLRTVLAAAGSSLDEVVKVNVYLTDMGDLDVVNRVYAEQFAEPYPARTTVAVAGLPRGAGVEIELVAREV